MKKEFIEKLIFYNQSEVVETFFEFFCMDNNYILNFLMIYKNKKSLSVDQIKEMIHHNYRIKQSILPFRISYFMYRWAIHHRRYNIQILLLNFDRKSSKNILKQIRHLRMFHSLITSIHRNSVSGSNEAQLQLANQLLDYEFNPDFFNPSALEIYLVKFYQMNAIHSWLFKLVMRRLKKLPQSLIQQINFKNVSRILSKNHSPENVQVYQNLFFSFLF
jgi:hypothetical protein